MLHSKIEVDSIPKQLFEGIEDEDYVLEDLDNNMRGEIFKYIPNTYHTAAVSNKGRVKVIVKNIHLKVYEWEIQHGERVKSGKFKDYIMVEIPIFKTNTPVYRKVRRVDLVMKAFGGEPILKPFGKYIHIDSLGNKYTEDNPPKFAITHLDHKMENDNISNLKWMTWSENRAFNCNDEKGNLKPPSKDVAVVIYTEYFIPIKYLDAVRHGDKYFSDKLGIEVKGHGAYITNDAKGNNPNSRGFSFDGKTYYHARYYHKLDMEERMRINDILKVHLFC